MFVDVLHHTLDPHALLGEARRVAGRGILIKDHQCDGLGAGQIQRFMDWFGNAPHGVALPHNYWSKKQWDKAFLALDLKIQVWHSRLGLYPFPANLIFERSLHFAALVEFKG